MRFLIVDASSKFRGALAAMLRARWPQAQTEEWDPSGGGRPPIEPGRYAVVLVDSQQVGDQDLAWVAAVRRDPGAPALLLITEQATESLAVKAMKAGASDFLGKNGLTGERLVRSVEEALLEQQARRQDATGGQAAYQKTVQFDAHKIGRPVQPGELVPGYRVERLIGEGGMAKVYLALRTHDGAQVALKVLDPRLQADETFLRRFVREYKMLASLDNEHVARVFDQGFSGEHPFIAMEYFPGGTLAARIHQGLTSLGAVRVAAQIARALDAVHAVGIVHRDLKPANILFRQNGRLAIVDFGLAKPAGITSTLTRVGEVLATPRYMSPEQCSGREVDARSDLYSLGVILYEMLTGSKLWGTAPPARMIELHLEGQVPRLGGRLAGYQSILDRLLAKEPGARYQSARELFAAIAV